MDENRIKRLHKSRQGTKTSRACRVCLTKAPTVRKKMVLPLPGPKESPAYTLQVSRGSI
jgi:hypothetical protein